MKRIAGLFVAAALVVMPLGTALAGGPDAMSVHRGTGVVTAISAGDLTMREGTGFHTMATGKETKILIAEEDRVATVGVGDYVAEECVPDGKGALKAVKLMLYRPAWMETAPVEN